MKYHIFNKYVISLCNIIIATQHLEARCILMLHFRERAINRQPMSFDKEYSIKFCLRFHDYFILLINVSFKYALRNLNDAD